MKRVLFFFACILLIAFLKRMNPEDSVTEKVDVENTKESSEHHVNVGKSIDSKFYNNGCHVCEKNIKAYESMLETADNFVQRYVSLFLITSDLRNYEVKDFNEEILIDLEISITGEDLAYLQGFSKRPKDSPFPKNFSKLDAIFSKIARLKERTYRERAIRSVTFFFSNTDFSSLLNNPTFYRTFSFSIILIALWTIRHYFFTRHFYVFIMILINSNILWEGLILYWKRIKETDTKLYVEMMQMKDLEAECRTEKRYWYSTVTNFLWPSKCLDYYTSLQKNALEEVSLFQSIVDTYMIYLIKTPVKLLSTSIRELTEDISGSLPWPLSAIVNIPLGVFFVIIVIFTILVLCGKRLKLSFFCSAIEIGDSVKNEPQKINLSITNNEREKPIRKLKPWTKSRFPKYISGDCGKRWKSNFKCLTEETHEDMPELNCSNEKNND